MPRPVLILFAHPAYEKSRVQAQLSAAVRDLPGVTFHDLYEAYPDLDIDVPREQALLTSHEAIVFQHPFYWYSVPPILKQWMDLVLEHGWAYGSKGRALEGKVWQVAMTVGGRREAYEPDGFNRYTIAEFLRPIEATARLCRMQYAEPFVVAGTHVITPPAIAAAAADYAALVRRLGEG
jgi:glutathione-regulated potassium-efflux system ancillary protein KefG